jgi:hypothetical protein
LQRDGGWKALDGIDRRNAKLMEESASIGRDRFKIATLRFGVDSTEGQRRLT